MVFVASNPRTLRKRSSKRPQKFLAYMTVRNARRIARNIRSPSPLLGFLARLHMARWRVCCVFPFPVSCPLPKHFIFDPRAGDLIKKSNSKVHYPPHSHRCLTTHLIRHGTLTITFPQDERPKRETFGIGERVDVEAGRIHEVWMGEEGCEYVIGEM